MDAVLVGNADRMMLSAALREDGIGLTVADGCGGVLPFVDLPEVGRVRGSPAWSCRTPMRLFSSQPSARGL